MKKDNETKHRTLIDRMSDRKREDALRKVRMDGHKLHKLRSKWKDDRGIVAEAIESRGTSFQFVSEELRSDKELIKMAVRKDAYNVVYISDELKDDVEFMMELVKENDRAIRWMKKELVLKNPQLAIEVLKTNGYMLHDLKRCISSVLADNRQVAIAAITQKAEAFIEISDRLKRDPEFMMEAIRISPLILEFANEDFKDNPEIVLEAVKRKGYALKYASDNLKNNIDIVIQAIKEYGPSLNFASDELRNNPKLLRLAIESCEMQDEQNGGEKKYTKYIKSFENALRNQKQQSIKEQVDVKDLTEQLIEIRAKCEEYKKLYENAKQLLDECERKSKEAINVR